MENHHALQRDNTPSFRRGFSDNAHGNPSRWRLKAVSQHCLEFSKNWCGVK